ncbi:hypothetical protein WKV44_08310 [Spirochaetia bacterium 38H-sp]|uniref:Beta-carotene 15,15'-monooxygenase n=1 Tax=Rarispira pelagica TaxID=3141764 RepID=A0ABU9UD02_9SPIR
MVLFAIGAVPILLFILLSIAGVIIESKEGLFRFLRGIILAIPAILIYMFVKDLLSASYYGMGLYIREGLVSLGFPLTILALYLLFLSKKWGIGKVRYLQSLWFSAGYLWAFSLIELLLNIRWLGAYYLFVHPVVLSVSLFFIPRLAYDCDFLIKNIKHRRLAFLSMLAGYIILSSIISYLALSNYHIETFIYMPVWAILSILLTIKGPDLINRILYKNHKRE